MNLLYSRRFVDFHIYWFARHLIPFKLWTFAQQHFYCFGRGICYTVYIVYAWNYDKYFVYFELVYLDWMGRWIELNCVKWGNIRKYKYLWRTSIALCSLVNSSYHWVHRSNYRPMQKMLPEWTRSTIHEFSFIRSETENFPSKSLETFAKGFVLGCQLQ